MIWTPPGARIASPGDGEYTYPAGTYVYAWFGIPDGERAGMDEVTCAGCSLGSFSCLPLSVSAVPVGAGSRSASLREGSPRSWGAAHAAMR